MQDHDRLYDDMAAPFDQGALREIEREVARMQAEAMRDIFANARRVLLSLFGASGTENRKTA